ncbi:hypothetical protein MP638_003416 [Amoeboaphelidium occidentale]|nr:hypothetical protein MP638_003416 [Amoeboaphelidium occidentale]
MQKPSQQQNATESTREMITAAVTSTSTSTQMKTTEKKSTAAAFVAPPSASSAAATSSSAFQASKGPTLNDKISGIHLDMSFTGLLNNTTQSDFKESFNFGPFGTVKQEGAMVAGAGTTLKAHDQQQQQLSQDVILKNLQKLAALEDENRNLRRRLRDMESSAVKNDTDKMEEDMETVNDSGFNNFKELGPISLAELREKPITSRLQYYQRIKTIK